MSRTYRVGILGCGNLTALETITVSYLNLKEAGLV